MLQVRLTKKQIINEVQQYFIDAGHTITHDWTASDGRNVTEMTPEEKLTFRRECAYWDIKGVQECDLLFVIMNHNTYPYRGTFTEIGCALGLNKKIIIVCSSENNYCATNCFFHHGSITHVKTIEEGFKDVVHFINYMNFG